MNEERITYFAQTDSRSKKINFGIKAKDRTRHVYVIGKTGMGKSTLLENMAVQDIKNGEGMAFIDPHGKTADLLLEYVPPERIKDVVYFAPFDTNFPISFNVLESVDPDKRHLVVSGLMSTFKKIWQDAWSARMEYILTNTLLALLEYPGATLLGVNRMLAEKDFRKDVIDHVTDISVKNFWVKEFANYTERMAAEAVPAIQNKIGQFTANALIRNMIGQPKSSFDIRGIMDSKKILIINLSKGRIGESNANLLGGMLITKIYLAALSRADLPERVLRTMPNFYLFVDEFQSFANESFADILSEARKYKLNLTIAHQYIEQMEEEVRAAVFGNVGTMIIFRVGAYDAEVLEKEFAPVFTAEDIVNLGAYQIYLKLMIDGISSAPFSATSLPPIPLPEVSSMEKVIESSRAQFAMNRAEVESVIEKWHEPFRKPPAPSAGAPVSASGGSGNSSSSILPPVVGGVIRNAPFPPRPPTGNSNSYNAVKSVDRSAGIPPVQQPPRMPIMPNRPAAIASTAPIPTAQPRFVPPSFHPSVPPRPRESQPFKQAFEKPLEREQVAEHKPVIESKQTPEHVPTPDRVIPTVASASVKADPISLASLSKRTPENFSSNKNDPKVPTTKNVNDLKNALASIIRKDVPTSPIDSSNTAKPKSTVPPIDSSINSVATPHKAPENKPVAVHNNAPTSAQEVPKDVLERILKVS